MADVEKKNCCRFVFISPCLDFLFFPLSFFSHGCAFVRVPFYARNARYTFEPFFLRAAIKATTVIYVHSDVKSPTRIRVSFFFFFRPTGLRVVPRFIARYRKNQDALQCH